MRRVARPEDDEENRADLAEALKALPQADKALRAAMNGCDATSRETFVDRTGVALSRLLKIWARIGDGEKP